MKIYFKHPNGWDILFETRPRQPHQPLEDGKFYALIALAAGALVVALLLGGTALK